MRHHREGFWLAVFSAAILIFSIIHGIESERMERVAAVAP